MPQKAPITSQPRWMFFRMHLAIALVTYNALVRLAPVRAPSRSAGRGVRPTRR